MMQNDNAIISYVARQAGRSELMNHLAFFMSVAALPFFNAWPLIIGSMISIGFHTAISNAEGETLRKEFEAATLDSRSTDIIKLKKKIDGLGRPLLKSVFKHPLNIALMTAFGLAGGASMIPIAFSAILLATENSRTRQVNDAVRQIQQNNPG